MKRMIAGGRLQWRDVETEMHRLRCAIADGQMRSRVADQTRFLVLRRGGQYRAAWAPEDGWDVVLRFAQHNSMWVCTGYSEDPDWYARLWGRR